jgi:hypothetical protein
MSLFNIERIEHETNHELDEALVDFLGSIQAFSDVSVPYQWRVISVQWRVSSLSVTCHFRPVTCHFRISDVSFPFNDVSVPYQWRVISVSVTCQFRISDVSVPYQYRPFSEPDVCECFYLKYAWLLLCRTQHGRNWRATGKCEPIFKVPVPCRRCAVRSDVIKRSRLCRRHSLTDRLPRASGVLSLGVPCRRDGILTHAETVFCFRKTRALNVSKGHCGIRNYRHWLNKTAPYNSSVIHVPEQQLMARKTAHILQVANWTRQRCRLLVW